MNLEKKGPQGKRWTFVMKCFALAIFKLSPKTYRFLRGMFNLLGESILKEVLYSIPFQTGFNPAVANKLKHDVPLLEVLDTYVTMSCDEMALLMMRKETLFMVLSITGVAERLAKLQITHSSS